ncbi:Patatin [Paenibacillus curdlanolyticus YK9]|uniref:Patatin n=1 Tax=Paenibacillus curdlanolyticus YK9 TaxID=717606 RepID=E0I9P8_9BACL|nr:patatin-like phospholipase family protein [Paenibacillus curdlanolyticus]EFM11132.1 Patatin [Paenibacillus curdlanolyticus YK9]
MGMIGLALSGGGYRASLYHLGVMARLADEGLLKEVRALSTVSGGSIVGAFYYKMLCEELRQDRKLTDEDYRDLMKRVIEAFVDVVQENLRDRVVISGGISRLVPEQILGRLLGAVHKVIPAVDPEMVLGSKLEQGISALMFKSLTLRDLMDAPVHPENRKPELILNTSILENGQSLFISTDPNSPLWRQNEYNHAITADQLLHLPLAKAVAASACVPGLFDPITIPFGDRAVHGVDGGVLDNLGGHAIQRLWLEGMPIMLSDASKPLRKENYEEIDAVESFFRIQDIFMGAIRDLRIEGTDDLIVGMRDEIPGVDSTVRTLAMTMRTDLNAFSEVEAYTLMYVGYYACDEQIEKLQGQGSGEWVSEQEMDDYWPFMSVRPYAVTPTPEYLALLGQKEKTLLSLPSLTMTRLLSLGYLLLYLAVFVYIWIQHGAEDAFWYVGLIPVLIVSLGGVVLLRRRVAKGKRKGTMASLVESSIPS